MVGTPVVSCPFSVKCTPHQAVVGLPQQHPALKQPSRPMKWPMAMPGAKASAVRVWPDDERRYDGKLLSDHAPVEVELEIPTKS